MNPVCDRLEGCRLRWPPLAESERRDALDARNLHDAGYTWRMIGRAMHRRPEQVRCLVQRLRREEDGR